MQVGDVAFFYHSNTKPPGIAGLMRIIAAQVVDPTQFETDSKYYDPKSTPEAPRWQTVTVEFMEAFETLIPLERLKQAFQPEELALVRKGNRLSVMPVEERVADRILALRN
jgi:predicted RNA-binding protein with PUA-like domain